MTAPSSELGAVPEQRRPASRPWCPEIMQLLVQALVLRRIRDTAGSSAMPADRTATCVAWATVTARHALELSSREARDAYFAERHDELRQGAVAEGAGEAEALMLADMCVDAARRIMTELMARRAGEPKGRA